MKLFGSTRYIAVLAGLVFWAGASAGEAEHDALLALAKDKDSEFSEALADAVEEGMSADWILEAEIARALATGDAEAMVGLIPRLDAVGNEFRFAVGRDFHSARQLEGFTDVLRCVVAYRSGDAEGFERYAVSSFEKAPGFSEAFGIGGLLARQRLESAREAELAGFRVPMDMVLANVEGESRTLAEWMGDDQAMLIDFWASWCGPCIRLMPELRKKQARLSEQGIFVAGVNTDRRDQLENARKVQEREGMASVPWLLDRNGGDLSGMLMIDSIPRMVLIDRKGSVLFNGHPVDGSLADALAELGVELGDA